MLAIPEKGFRRSINEHNSDVICVADWVEASLLFKAPVISKMDVWDTLIDASIYDDQAFAARFVEIIWNELTKRTQWIGKHCPFVIGANTVSRVKTWREAVGHSFTIFLTCLQTYSSDDYPALHPADENHYRYLFECFSEESLALLGWDTYRTGWASGIANPAFSTIVQQVAHTMNESWTNSDAIDAFHSAKEQGLDLLIHQPFSDKRVGKPYFLLQCASGKNWREKLDTPKLSVWSQLIQFTIPPRRGLCCPIAINDDKLKTTSIESEGFIVDRYRLLSAGAGLTRNLSTKLRNEIKAFMSPLLAELPEL